MGRQDADVLTAPDGVPERAARYDCLVRDAAGPGDGHRRGPCHPRPRGRAAGRARPRRRVRHRYLHSPARRVRGGGDRRRRRLGDDRRRPPQGPPSDAARGRRQAAAPRRLELRAQPRGDAALLRRRPGPHGRGARTGDCARGPRRPRRAQPLEPVGRLAAGQGLARVGDLEGGALLLPPRARPPASSSGCGPGRRPTCRPHPPPGSVPARPHTSATRGDLAASAPPSVWPAEI